MAHCVCGVCSIDRVYQHCVIDINCSCITLPSGLIDKARFMCLTLSDLKKMRCLIWFDYRSEGNQSFTLSGSKALLICLTWNRSLHCWFCRATDRLCVLFQLAQDSLQCAGQVCDPLPGLSVETDPGSAARGQRCGQHTGCHGVWDTAAGRRCIWGRTLFKCGSLWRQVIYFGVLLLNVPSLCLVTKRLNTFEHIMYWRMQLPASAFI